jgi:hypothetical protein
MVFDRLPTFAIATSVPLSQFFVVWNVLSKVVNHGLRQMYRECSILAYDMRRLITLRVIMIKENGRG